MRILHWTESFWPRIGGAERMAGLLAADAVRRGHEAMVVSDTADGLAPLDQHEGVTIRRFPFQATLTQRNLRGVIALAQKVTACIRDFGPEVAHLHTSQPGAFFFLRMTHALPRPSIYTTHDPMEFARAQSPLLAQITQTVSAIAAISPFMLGEVTRMFPAASSRARCIWYGLPWPIPAPAPLPWHPPVVFAAGRLIRSKGFDTLLQAFARLAPRRPALRLVIAGDGEQRDELTALARALAIGDSTRFLGRVPHDAIGALIEQATVVVVPSRWQEPFGLVALEAMQRGRPVVASRVGGLVDVLGETGLLVPAEEPALFAEAIGALIGNRDRAVEIGRAGRERAEATFNWHRFADDYAALYREVAG